MIHYKDGKGMASQLAAAGLRTSFLNPSDCIAVMQGCIGYGLCSCAFLRWRFSVCFILLLFVLQVKLQLHVFVVGYLVSGSCSCCVYSTFLRVCWHEFMHVDGCVRACVRVCVCVCVCVCVQSEACKCCCMRWAQVLTLDPVNDNGGQSHDALILNLIALSSSLSVRKALSLMTFF